MLLAASGCKIDACVLEDHKVSEIQNFTKAVAVAQATHRGDVLRARENIPAARVPVGAANRHNRQPPAEANRRYVELLWEPEAVGATAALGEPVGRRVAAAVGGEEHAGRLRRLLPHDLCAGKVLKC